MTTGRRTRTLAVCTALALAGTGTFGFISGASAAVGGELVYGLTADDRLVSFRSEQPGTLLSNVAITTANILTTQLPGDFLGIDVRPRTGELYALGDNSQLYVINPATGVATERGAAITPAVNGGKVGFDFNPVADRIRIVTDADQNLRVNPDTGGASAVTAPATATDGPLRYNDADQFAGANPAVGAAAYTNSVDGTTTTAQFDIDLNLNTFVRQDSNPGILTTVGNLGVGDVTDAGLDVSAGSDTTYGLLTTTGAATVGTGTRPVDGFYRINRTTGAATLVGEVGPAPTATAAGVQVEDITVATSRFLVTATTVTEGGTANVTVTRTGDTADSQTVAFAIGNGTTGNAFQDAADTRGTLTFGPGETSRTFAVSTIQDDFTEGTETLAVQLSDATTGAVASNGVLTITDDEPGNAVGLTSENSLVTFSINTPGTLSTARPILGLPNGVRIVGIDVRPRTGELIGVGSNSVLYALNAQTGVATEKGALAIPLSGTTFGVDFNPVADRLRIVSDTDQNLRVNVDAPAGVGTGTILDGVLRYAEGDVNTGTNPAVAGAAYSNSFNSGPGNTATPTADTNFRQVDIDTATSSLVLQASNPGTLTTIGSLGLPTGTAIAATPSVGLDIAAAGNAVFASFSTTVAPSTTPGARTLYRITPTGRAVSIGAFGTANGLAGAGQTVDDFALTDTDRSTFTAPASPAPTGTASPTPSGTASPTPSASPSATPTAGTPTPSQTAPGALSIALNRTVIVPGVPVTVTVTGSPGSIVELRAYSRPSTDYVVVRRGNLGLEGETSFDVTPGTNTRLFAQVTGFNATASASQVINVRTALSLTVVRNGTRNYTFQGRILPRRAGQLITLFRVDNGRRIITNQIKTDSTGTYRINRRFTGSGTFGFLTRTGQTLTNAAGESNTRPENVQSGRGTVRPTAIF